MSRFQLHGTARKQLDIEHVESREDWVSLPWGAKHQSTYRQISIVQRLSLMDKKEEEHHGPSGRPSIQHPLIYHFQLDQHKDEMDYDATLERLKELHRMMFRSTDLILRNVSTLRKDLLDLLATMSSAELAHLTGKAQDSFSSSQWYVPRSWIHGMSVA